MRCVILFGDKRFGAGDDVAFPTIIFFIYIKTFNFIFKQSIILLLQNLLFNAFLDFSLNFFFLIYIFYIIIKKKVNKNDKNNFLKK